MQSNRLWMRALLAAVVALVSVVVTKLSLFAALGTFLAWASLPHVATGEANGGRTNGGRTNGGRTNGGLKAERWLLLLAMGLSTVGLFRFLVGEAVPGIVAGGNRATEQRAISRLREVLFAEDSARRHATHDPDRDRIGSAALLGELTGELALRGGKRLVPPLLESYPKLVGTPLGPATEIGGYLLIVCLPRLGGGFTAQPFEAIDDELAERRFIAYAWPSEAAPGLTRAVALDQHERIWLATAVPGKQRSGFKAPPRCDDAIAPSTQRDWQPWRDKLPRASLPGG